MAEDDELEKRAIEELLRETDRARMRAETMGPGGWLKCPLRSTNKRFLLNTLRSTGLERHTDEPRTGRSSTRERLRHESPEGRCDRSRTPPADHRSKNGGHTDHKHHSRISQDKRLDRDKDGRYRHRDDRDRRRLDGQNRDKERRPQTS
ncbi:uncharacterized protein FYW49_016886 [Xenentodon cancila]